MPQRLTHLDTIRANPVLQQRLAKYLVLQCVRNSHLEDLHAGIAPSSATGDYADVTVTTPFGSIPWPRVSRFNDEEMKQLMMLVFMGEWMMNAIQKEPDLAYEALAFKIFAQTQGTAEVVAKTGDRK